jgi:uncharacterized protein (DUF2252 family)
MSILSERLKAFNAHLLPDIIQLKYKAMTESTFRFYRGTCHLFYEDLSNATPLPLSPLTWICGDLHLENYGSFKGDNKMVYFDLNDFDEGLLAPAVYELARMVTSIFIAFDTLELDLGEALKLAGLYLKTYAATLAKTKAISIDPRTAKGIVCDFLTAVEKTKEKDLLKKRTVGKEKKRELAMADKWHIKLIELNKKLQRELIVHMNKWIATSNDSSYDYKVKGVIFRVAGTGSLGVKRYLFLLKSGNTKNKYLLVDMKQAEPSSVKPYVDVQQLQWETEAERVVAIQKRMQNVSANLLGTTVFNGDPYVVQQLQPVKDTFDFNLLKDDQPNTCQVIDDMAALAASAQLRSGGMQGSSIIDDLSAFGKSDKWQQAVLDYSMKYAQKVKRDYQQYLKDFKNGVFELKDGKEKGVS